MVRYDAHLARLVHQIPAYLVGVLCVEIAQAHGGQVLGVGFRDADEFVEYLEVFFCFVLDVGEHGGLAFGRKGGRRRRDVRRTSGIGASLRARLDACSALSRPPGRTLL